jgi:hypothetical protein
MLEEFKLNRQEKKNRKAEKKNLQPETAVE